MTLPRTRSATIWLPVGTQAITMRGRARRARVNGYSQNSCGKGVGKGVGKRDKEKGEGREGRGRGRVAPVSAGLPRQ
eukprot:Skav213431  [mRNA]  locus=scaffold3465:30338:30582:+ [translate_table: standard]